MTLMTLMSSVVKIASFMIFNSSMNIQEDILKRRTDVRLLAMGLNDHTDLTYKQIKFSDNLTYIWGRNDFHHYFWF